MSDEPPPKRAARAAPGLLPWAVAAGLAVVSAWLGALYYGARLEAESRAQAYAMAQVALQSADVQLQAERLVGSRLAADYAKSRSTAAGGDLALAGLKVAILRPAGSGMSAAVAVAVWDPTHAAGVLTAEGLPPNRRDERYELWLVGTKPVGAGGFTVGADGRARLSFHASAPVPTVSRFAVTREPNDGRRSPTSPGQVILRSR